MHSMVRQAFRRATHARSSRISWCGLLLCCLTDEYSAANLSSSAESTGFWQTRTSAVYVALEQSKLTPLAILEKAAVEQAAIRTLTRCNLRPCIPAPHLFDSQT